MGTSQGGKSTRAAGAAWLAERGTDLGEALPSYWPEQLTEAVVAEARGEPHAPPETANAPPWERWFERALDHGVDEALAGLGRALIREACDARWSDERAADGGLLDEGEGMLELALNHPDHAELRWHTLLDDER